MKPKTAKLVKPRCAFTPEQMLQRINEPTPRADCLTCGKPIKLPQTKLCAECLAIEVAR
jgi:hypothetical protein